MTEKLESFTDLVGQTITNVDVTGHDITFTLANGDQYMLFHRQDCCEDVHIEDICGDWADIVGHEIRTAREVVGGDGRRLSEYDEDFQWTFYDIATFYGSVTIRFYGGSNGYYSIDVSWDEV